MHRITRGAFALLVLISLASVPPTGAQDSLAAAGSGAAAKPAGTTRTDSSRSRFARYLRYPWNGVNVWAGSAYETRSASHNEHIAGSMRIVGVQISRDVWRGTKSRLAYVGEVLPVMLVRSGPPLRRALDTLRKYDADQIKRFSFRDSYGFGLAPFGAELSRQFTPKFGALFNVTAGALLFNNIVPYGAATNANFTVSPGVALELEPMNRTRIAVGYTFHHLSNAHFGKSNPGMNSQILYVRVTRIRRGARGDAQ